MPHLLRRMFKLGIPTGRDWDCTEHSHPPVYKIRSGTGRRKILATAPGSDPLIFKHLAQCLTSPLYLLYVLHTPCGEGQPGRYQSPEMSHEEFREFVGRFDRFLRADARFDLWVYSLADQATIVWDRHNLVHGYGQVDCMTEALRALGFEAGQPTIPSPHVHNYHASLDGDARDILTHVGWARTPLKPEDEQ